MSSQSNDIPDGFRMTEHKLLPEHWQTGHLGDVCQIQVGFPYDSEGFKDTPTQESVPIIRIRDLLSGEAHTYYSGSNISDTLDTYLINKDDTLIGMDGNFHVTRWKGRSGLLNQRIAHLKEFSSDVYCDYIYYAVITPIKTIENSKHYTTVKHLSMGDLRNLSIPLPPLHEQKAIARVLSTIQQAIEAQDKIIAAARELKKSLMRHLFTYGPVPVAEAEQVSLKETEIGPVPEYWEVKRLIEVAISNSDIVGGPFGSNLKVSDYQKSGIPIIRLQNIERNKFVNKDIKFISKEKAEELKYHSFSAGDIVLAKLGDPIGKTCIVPDDLVGGIVVADVVRIRTDPALTYKDYIVYALNTNFCGEQFRSQKTGTTRPRVNVSNVRNLLIPVAPIDEQQDIARALLTVDEKIETEENRKVSLQTLFKTMLHQLMTGKLRVNSLEAPVS